MLFPLLGSPFPLVNLADFCSCVRTQFRSHLLLEALWIPWAGCRFHAVFLKTKITTKKYDELCIKNLNKGEISLNSWKYVVGHLDARLYHQRGTA